MTSQKITIAVPTHNRPAFLNRLLMFFSQVSCRVPIIVMDSSDADIRDVSRSVVESVRDRLEIEYRHLDLPCEEKCTAVLTDISTPYVQLSADDDFVVPASLAECVAFLDAHPDYATVRGVQYNLNTCRGGRLKKTRYREVNQSDPVARFRFMADCWFSNFYSVYRTEDLQVDFELTCKSTSTLETIILPELLLSYLSVIRGKGKYLTCLSGLVQSHQQCASRTAAKISDPENYPHQYERFESCLSDALVRAVGIRDSEARELVRKYHGPVRDSWEQVTTRKPGIAGWLQRESARPIRKAKQILRHGTGSLPWKSHPFVPGQTRTEIFVLMQDLMLKYPDGCPPGLTETRRDAA